MTGPFELIKPVPTAKAQEMLRVAEAGRKARLHRDAEVRRQRVLEAAWALATEAGLKAVNMRDVGVKAGYTAGALYSYFPSREHLLTAMRHRVLHELAEQQARAVKDGFKQGRRAADPFREEVGRDAYELATLGWWRMLCHDPNRVALLLHSAGRVVADPSPGGPTPPDLIDELVGATQVSLGCLGRDGGGNDGESLDLAVVHRAVLSLAVGLLVGHPSALGSPEGRVALTQQLLSGVRVFRSAMLGDDADGRAGAGGLQVDLFGQPPLP